MPVAIEQQTTTPTLPVNVEAAKSKAASTPSYGYGLDHQAMLSHTALLRPDSAIRSLFPAERTPGMLSLLAGKPNTDTFPISNISLTLKPIADEEETVLSINGSDLEEGLQYGQTWGLTRLLDWLTQYQSRLHGRTLVKAGCSDSMSKGLNPWRVSIGGGSQDLLTKTFNAILNPGDSVLVESPVYTGILPTLAALQVNVVGVQTDAEGLMSTSLEETLSSWHTSPRTASHPFPKLIYTVPTAANPSGATASEQRKKEVLAIARRYGVMIMEDDPYMLLSYAGLGEDTPETRRRVRTYWSLEQDEAEQWGTGWVVRFDSFSKILSGGIRVGFITGPKVIVDYVDKETSSANLQGSGASQAIVLAILEHWGYEGLLRHCDRVAAFYRQRRDNFEAKARLILGPQSDGRPAVAEWVTPEAGMFLWLRLNLPPVNVPGGQHGDSYSLVSEKAREKGVLAVPGVAFMPNAECSSYVRTSYSIIPEKDVGEAFKRLRDSVEEAWQEQGLIMI